MKIILSVFAVLITLKIFPQNREDIRGVYMHTEMNSLAVSSTSITVFTEASKNINRPTINVFLGPHFSPSTYTFNLATSNTINGINVSTYSRTLSVSGITGNFNPTYTDSFLVAGIKNCPANQLRMIYAQAQTSGITNKGPEITNLPLSPLNYTTSGNQVLYNPICQDSNGDSLSYTLENTMWANSSYIPLGATINPTTGLFSFSKDSTDLTLYVFLINIFEWRKVNGFMEKIGFSQLVFEMTSNLTLNVKDNLNTSFSFKFYPNPTSNYLVVNNPSLLNQNLKYAIYDFQGGKISEGKINTNEQKNIDVSFLPQGLYLINICNGSRTFSNKFVKTVN